jgi:hypothetical protein
MTNYFRAEVIKTLKLKSIWFILILCISFYVFLNFVSLLGMKELKTASNFNYVFFLFKINYLIALPVFLLIPFFLQYYENEHLEQISLSIIKPNLFFIVKLLFILVVYLLTIICTLFISYFVCKILLLYKNIMTLNQIELFNDQFLKYSLIFVFFYIPNIILSFTISILLKKYSYALLALLSIHIFSFFDFFPFTFINSVNKSMNLQASIDNGSNLFSISNSYFNLIFAFVTTVLLLTGTIHFTQKRT